MTAAAPSRVRLTERWRRWAFDPIDTASMSILRIACGLLVIGWTSSYLPDAQAFLSDNGLTAHAIDGTAGWWTLPVVSPYGALAILLVAAVALTVGWHTRVASIVVAFLLIVIERRDIYVLNSGDLLLRELAILVALMPAGELWALDARRRRNRGRAPALRAPWGLRLLQLQVSCLYLFSVLAKANGDSWQNGSAVGKSLQLEDLQRIALPQWFDTSVTSSAVLTYGTLIVESSLVLGLWFPRTRYKVMAAGVAMHLGIEGTLLIGWFSLTVISCYLAFVPPADLRRFLRYGRRRYREAVAGRRAPSVDQAISASDRFPGSTRTDPGRT